MISLLIVLAGIGLLAWSFNSPARKRRAASRSRVRLPSAERYRAVSILSRSCACSTVSELEGRRFLADEAPLLPVPGCDAAKCGCRYARHGDRRRRGDRRLYAGLQTELYTATGRTERRSLRGRRKRDFELQGSDFELGEIVWVK